MKSRDKIVEIGLVGMSPDGQIEWEWETLINPKRDVSMHEVHGITAQEVLNAPEFTDVAGQVASLMKGRIPVAHNASFDASFLRYSYLNDGWEVAGPLDYNAFLCTMLLGGDIFPGIGRSLDALCDATGIDNQCAHRALADAHATARLLGIMLDETYGNLPRMDQLEQHPAEAWPDIPIFTTEGLARETAATIQPTHFLARLVDHLPSIPTNSDEAQLYLAQIDQALLDRHISAREHDQLQDTANQLRVDRYTAEHLHLKYLESVAVAALLDDTVTDEERADLELVASLLDLSSADVDNALELAAQTTEEPTDTVGLSLSPGDRVVITGPYEKTKAEWTTQANAVGVEVATGVSKKVKLLVAGDPDSLSGKARRATELNIPIVHETAFASMLIHQHQNS